jgi:hypothetical protein
LSYNDGGCDEGEENFGQYRHRYGIDCQANGRGMLYTIRSTASGEAPSITRKEWWEIVGEVFHTGERS